MARSSPTPPPTPRLLSSLVNGGSLTPFGGGARIVDEHRLDLVSALAQARSCAGGGNSGFTPAAGSAGNRNALKQGRAALGCRLIPLPSRLVNDFGA